MVEAELALVSSHSGCNADNIVGNASDWRMALYDWNITIIRFYPKKYLIDIPVEKILDFEKALFEYVDTKYPEAVSYTHLDVYKRQIMNRLLKAAGHQVLQV